MLLLQLLLLLLLSLPLLLLPLPLLLLLILPLSWLEPETKAQSQRAAGDEIELLFIYFISSLFRKGDSFVSLLSSVSWLGTLRSTERLINVPKRQ